MSPLSEPAPAVAGLPRYAPGRAFPNYRFVPGLNPHPVSDPRGHSYRAGKPEAPPPPLDPAQWQRSEEYRFGCDLYNHAYYWEAHEEWEGLWHLTNKSGETGLFLQGLIQAGASHLKRHMGDSVGREKLARLSVEKLKRVAAAVAPRRDFLGVELELFIAAVEAYLVRGEPAAPWPAIVLTGL